MKFLVMFFIRFFDVFLSLSAMIVLLPFMTPIMIILKLTGEHDIFYVQKRVGRNGKEFGLFKFATMLRDSPNLPGGFFTSENDPRVLYPLGNFLRKSKINELPQIVNILLGQMSIVGYRPLVKGSYEHYSDDVKRQLYDFKPGLSGISSIILRNEEKIMQKVDGQKYFYDNVIRPYKGKLETWYVNNISVLMYVKIILITIVVVIKPSSDIWKKSFENLPRVPEALEKYVN